MFKAVEIDHKEATENAVKLILSAKEITGGDLKVTKVRSMILEAVMSIKGAFSTNDVLKLIDYTLSTASVYNTLKLFEEKEIIEKVPSLKVEINYRLKV